ncbi:MAG TPA: hypothetical protein VFF89_06645 [Sphingobium sp.]|nr:hypothetical protein [Sphingobium sp.]
MTRGLFNASIDGNVRRAINIREGEAIDAPALVRAAVALEKAKKKRLRHFPRLALSAWRVVALRLSSRCHSSAFGWTDSAWQLQGERV